MARAEFKMAVKRAARARANGLCEAVGPWYGLAEGQRCNVMITRFVEFDHIILEANSHDNSLENCACVCIPCHKIKTAKHDTPLAAKTLRQQDKASGVSKPRGFPKPPDGFKFSWRSGRMERT